MEVQNGALAPAVGLEVGAFFENVVLNEAIWCTIFHHVKHFNSMSTGMFFTVEQAERIGQSKSGGAMPPQSEKWRGHCPPPPGCAAYASHRKLRLFAKKD